MSLGQPVRDAVVSFIFWTVASALAVLIPYGLGALVPVLGILATIRDLEYTTTASATVGAFVSLLLAAAINDQPAIALYFAAVLFGGVSILGKLFRQ